MELSVQYDHYPAEALKRNQLPKEEELPFRAVALLDREKQWRIVEVRMDVDAHFPDMRPPDTVTYKSRAKYGHDLNGVEVPVRIDTAWIRPMHEEELLVTWHIEDVSSCRSEDEGFRLTAFGLPEPPGVEWERSTPLYIWLAVGALLCLMGGFFIYVVKRRFRTKAS